MYTFHCPSKGTVSILVDTTDDTGANQSNLDLVLEVTDGKGNLLLQPFGNPNLTGDDEAACTFIPGCGFACPQVIDLACGKGNPHTLAIFSFPTAPGCIGGGGYILTISALNKKGKVVKDKAIKLGGGPPRKTPKWADGVVKNQPALNDEGVPSHFFTGGPFVINLREFKADLERTDSETEKRRYK